MTAAWVVLPDGSNNQLHPASIKVEAEPEDVVFTGTFILRGDGRHSLRRGDLHHHLQNHQLDGVEFLGWTERTVDSIATEAPW